MRSRRQLGALDLAAAYIAVLTVLYALIGTAVTLAHHTDKQHEQPVTTTDTSTGQED